MGSGTMSIGIVEAVQSLKPNAEFTLEGTSFQGLTWVDKIQTQPTEVEIDAEVKRLQAEYDAQEYARKRSVAYPSVGDQLDMIYKDIKNSTTTHAEAVEAVKTKFPKE